MDTLKKAVMKVRQTLYAVSGLLIFSEDVRGIFVRFGEVALELMQAIITTHEFLEVIQIIK